MLELLKVIFLGIVEGITEWLPISSTGHMIIVDQFMSLNVSEAFKEMFFVVIQLGAILAVVYLYWKRLMPFSFKDNKIMIKKNTTILWLKIIVADAWHHRSDALSSAGTFIGVLGARLGLIILDPIAAIVVSIFIIKMGIDLYLKSIRGLVDESADKYTIEKIEAITASVKGVITITDLKTRIFGNKIYVDLDIAVDGNLTVREGHDIAKVVHDLIEEKIDDVKHCMVHVEPYSNNKDGN